MELFLRDRSLEPRIRSFLQTRHTDTPFVDCTGSLVKGVSMPGQKVELHI